MSSNFSTAPISKRSIHLLPLHHHSGRAGLGNRCTFYSVPPSSRPSPYRSCYRSHTTLKQRYPAQSLSKSIGRQNLAAAHRRYRRRHRKSLHPRHLAARQHPTCPDPLDQNPPAASPPLIGILSEKGYNQVLAVLAILKSGHAYLPLSIDWPLGRLDEVLTQGQVKLVLISQAQYGREAIRNALSQKYTLRVIETSQADPVPRAATLPE